jgi:hypothetical protein
LISIWDKDGSNSTEFMGSLILTLDHATLNPTQMPHPAWHDAFMGSKKGDCGKLLCSLIAYNRLELIPKNPDIEPPYQKYFLNMKILGLRKLHSAGLLPVKRAYIRFDIDSLRRKKDKSFLPEKKFVSTEPLEPGSNPNILTVLK